MTLRFSFLQTWVCMSWLAGSLFALELCASAIHAGLPLDPSLFLCTLQAVCWISWLHISYWINKGFKKYFEFLLRTY